MTTLRQDTILQVIEKQQPCTSTDIVTTLNESSPVSSATVKRDLVELLQTSLITKYGTGKGTRYRLSDSYRILLPIAMDTYFRVEQDERTINESFNWGSIEEILPQTALFYPQELSLLQNLQNEFAEKIGSLNAITLNKDLERLAIDLSWKSSQIEGNTYTLLETERLIKESQSADGKSREEALMLLNHKTALDSLVQKRILLDPLTFEDIKHVHYKLVVGLDNETDIRAYKVGITGTNYQPLENLYDIRRALEETCELINSKTNVFEKALLALAMLSYIQPFADGNKRTARLICNGILLANGYCPLSFRTVDSLIFKQAVLLFYEQQNLSNLKRIFIEQYAFAVSTYF